MINHTIVFNLFLLKIGHIFETARKWFFHLLGGKGMLKIEGILLDKTKSKLL